MTYLHDNRMEPQIYIKKYNLIGQTNVRWFEENCQCFQIGSVGWSNLSSNAKEAGVLTADTRANTHTLLKHKYTHRHIMHCDLFTLSMTGVCFKCAWQALQMRRMGRQGSGTLLGVYIPSKEGTETYAVVTTVEIPLCFYCHGCRGRTLQYLFSVVYYICKASSVDMVRGGCRFHSVAAWLWNVTTIKRMQCTPSREGLFRDCFSFLALHNLSLLMEKKEMFQRVRKCFKEGKGEDDKLMRIARPCFVF